MTLPVVESFDFFERNKNKNPHKMPKAHFHTHHELYYLVSGKTRYFVGSKLYLLEAGDMIFVTAGEFHQTAVDDMSGVERILLIFDNDFIAKEYEQYSKPLLERKHIRIKKEYIPLFNSFFKEIENECKSKLTGYTEMKKLYLSKLFIMISRYMQEVIEQNKSPTYELIRSAAHYIETNYNQDLSLEALSQKYSISRGHFSKLFKKVTGVSLNEYITITRVSVAKEMLARGNSNITSVAFKCGYNDSNYFTRIFKKVTGVTPKKYSKELAQ